MARGVRFKVEIDNNMRRFLKDMPLEIQKKVFVGAGGRVARQGLAVVKANTPVAAKKNKGYEGKPHARDVMTTKQKTYKNTGAVFLIGPRSRQAPHTHLIEKGTDVRFTGNKSLYGNVGSKMVRVKGRLKRRNIRKKIGDEATGAVRQNRGRMPAFGMLAKGLAIMRTNLPMAIERSFLALIRRYSK